MSQRLNVNFSEEAYEELRQIAIRRNKTISELIRGAIGFECWYDDIKQQGGKLVAWYPDGRVQEVVRG